MAVTVKELSEQELDVFVDFPFELYKDDPYWVSDLKEDVQYLIAKNNNFWTHGDRALFMAYQNGKPVGRIMALVNRAHNEYQKENIGFFGFFDCVNSPEAANALFAAAENWLRAKGVSAVRGPASPSSNHIYGLLVEGFDGMPAIMMPYTRCSRGKGITLRRLNLKKIHEEAEIIRKIYNEAWAENWGFVPMSEREMADVVKELRLVVRKEGTCVLEVDGVPAGFYILIPNMNHVLKELKGSLANPWRLIKALWAWRKIKDARMIMLGVSPKFRQRGIDLILIKHIIDHGVAVWNEAELSWVLEDNEGIIRGIMECGCHPSKRYRIYQKSL